MYLDEFNSMQFQVMRILKEVPEARNSDDLLLKELTRRTGKQLNLEEYNISMAIIKSMERARRKVQELNPALKALENVQEKRKEMQEQYKEYFR